MCSILHSVSFYYYYLYIFVVIKHCFYVSTSQLIFGIRFTLYCLPSGLFNPSTSYKMQNPLVSCVYPECLFVFFLLLKTCSVWVSLVEINPLEPIFSTTSIDSNLIPFTSMTLSDSLRSEQWKIWFPVVFFSSSSNFRQLCKAHRLNK